MIEAQSSTPTFNAPPPRPWAVIVVMSLCVWLFGWQLTLGADGAARAHYLLGVTPAVLTGRAVLHPDLDFLSPPLTLITGVLFHGEAWLVLLNISYLWFFGSLLERALSSWRLLAIFCLGGTCAGLTASLLQPLSQTPLTGAGGAVSALLGAALVLHPGARLALFNPPRLHLPIVVLVVLWVVAHGLLPSAYPWSAHAVAMIAGAIGIMFVKQPLVRIFN